MMAEKNETKPSVTRSELVAALEVPGPLVPLAKRADKLAHVNVSDSPDAFGVIWEAGSYLDPSDKAVRELAVEASKLGLTRRTVSLALGFHRPSAFDRALKAGLKAGAPAAEKVAS